MINHYLLSDILSEIGRNAWNPNIWAKWAKCVHKTNKRSHVFSKKKLDTCKKTKIMWTVNFFFFFFFHWLSPLKVILFERKQIIGHQMWHLLRSGFEFWFATLWKTLLIILKLHMYYTNNSGITSTNRLIYPLLPRLIAYKRDINIGIYFCQKIYIGIYYDQIFLANKLIL